MDKKFKASSGFDASGQKIINVAKASKESIKDAVNVEFFDENNTVQLFSETRPYSKDFAVVYDRKLYVSKNAITVGPFNPLEWSRVRVDTEFTYINQTPVDGHNLKYGDSIIIDSQFNELLFILPTTRIEGESVVIRDIGLKVGDSSVTIRSEVGDIKTQTSLSATYKLTVPGVMIIFTYSRGVWASKVVQSERKYYASNSDGIIKTQASDVVYKNTNSGLITASLPKYANNGDVITFFDIDQMNSKNHTIVSVAADSGHTIESVATPYTDKTLGVTRFIFNSTSNNWKVWLGDLRGRIKNINQTTYNMVANESIFVKCRATPTTPFTTTINLPSNVSTGDICRIITKCTMAHQTVVIKTTGTDKILRSIDSLEYPKFSSFPTGGDQWEQTTQITITSSNYKPTIELFYNEIDKIWYVSEYQTTVEKVDSLNRDRFGVIQLASIVEGQVDKSANPDKEKAVTVEVLSNRTATENRQGIAAIASTAEVNQLSTSIYDDLKIVTPKKLNERIATETRRGMLEIATQTETNSSTIDDVIITPKKLSARQATESLTGIIQLESTGATAGASRIASGTGSYNFNSNTKAITAKSLNELVATDKAKGIVYLATEVETTAAVPPVYDPLIPLVPTIQMLDKKVAKEDRKGFTQIATQVQTNTGTDDFVYITPKKLNSRTASESLTGIIRVATKAETDAGVSDNVALTPKKLNDRKATDQTDGIVKLVIDGNAGVNRTTSGTGVFDFNDVSKAITSKAINTLIATDKAKGIVYLATEAEVTAITPVATNASQPLVVTIQTLDKKVAKEDRKGFTQIATQVDVLTGTDDFKYITPKKLKTSQEVFVNKAGGVMTGKLTLNAPVLPALPEVSENSLPTEPTAGVWVSKIKTKIAEYPRSFIYGTEVLSDSGVLANFGVDTESVTQIWTPTKGNKKFIRSGNAAGFGAWDEIYTKNNKPTPTEIGSVSNESGSLESLIVRDFVQIGNVRIKVNQEKRALDFVWVDDPLGG